MAAPLRDPFKIAGRTALSLSGGRTSAYMLWLALQSNGGALPSGCIVLFANTGREDEKTLRFVRAIETNWNVSIVWLEYRSGLEHLGDFGFVPAAAPEQTFAVVNFENASRDGEPFEALIRRRRFLPNPVSRFCTSELKIRTMHRYLRSIGWYDDDDGWDQFIGIRADEPRRVAKIRARGVSTESARETMVLPLAEARVTNADVMRFWAEQSFDLGLDVVNGRTPDGNCDNCFLKPPAVRLSNARRKPEGIVWWARQEEWASGVTDHPRGARFTKDGPSYAQIADYARDQLDLFDADEEAIACFCGD